MNYRNPRLAAVCIQSAVLVISVFTSVLGAEGVPPGVSKLIAEAEVVVVGTAERTESLWKENSRGDKMIVSRTLIQTREDLKGHSANAIWVDVEGGTLDGVTLRVSGSPTFKDGDNAVLFLKKNTDGSYSLYQHGRGVLKLDERDIVRGTTLALDDIRQAANSRTRSGQ
jgi:hypothetical protein